MRVKVEVVCVDKTGPHRWGGRFEVDDFGDALEKMPDEFEERMDEDSIRKVTILIEKVG